MNIKKLGSEYGGWVLDIDSINPGDTIIDAGLGEDISFLEELCKHKDVKIIGIDPTEKSHIYIEKHALHGDKLELIKCAIAPKGTDKIVMYKNSNPEHVSESLYSDHQSTKSDTYEVKCISISDLISKYNPSVVKIDIEGAEYDVYKEILGVKQICIEFHHHCIDSISEECPKTTIKL
jgi:FkbM family methyltransferase